LGLCRPLDEDEGVEGLVEGFLAPLPESPDDEVIKGDHQKADNAAVPDHL